MLSPTIRAPIRYFALLRAADDKIAFFFEPAFFVPQ